jgi:hypothetical protein
MGTTFNPPLFSLVNAFNEELDQVNQEENEDIGKKAEYGGGEVVGSL